MTPYAALGATVIVNDIATNDFTYTPGFIAPFGLTITLSGMQVDEIYFEAEFDWDPGINYIFKGHKRTGFAEDENPHYSN